jgi:hypothetical protein
MYVRSHIDTVSGNRKYIYIDENNKKYIKDKNKYYPIKKYKGAYTLQKIRGGDASIEVQLHLYGIKDADGKVSEDKKIFDTTIDLSNIVLNPDDYDTYKKIIKDNKISIYNKGFAPIDIDFTSNNINHFITIKNISNKFKVYFKNYTSVGSKFTIESYSSFYNIIYKRNNRIDKDSEATSKDTFFVIFSIIEDYDDTDFILDDNYTEIPYVYNQEYNSLYDTTLDKLKKIYQ